eukprot:gnl/Hemi2/26832_TR9027_c0_g1_i1.p1 gnl/Hemi2/26832_TR9027_c0_g1~~gnl/Hemi2/26832_TR9027_c0_g1_i1.p1  ORF type:complete len:224 (-),score=56.67 gnl/Hemi2/26832_TR9027_c0_g1_i1:75-746(-)
MSSGGEAHPFSGSPLASHSIDLADNASHLRSPLLSAADLNPPTPRVAPPSDSVKCILHPHNVKYSPATFAAVPTRCSCCRLDIPGSSAYYYCSVLSCTFYLCQLCLTVSTVNDSREVIEQRLKKAHSHPLKAVVHPTDPRECSKCLVLSQHTFHCNQEACRYELCLRCSIVSKDSNSKQQAVAKRTKDEDFRGPTCSSCLGALCCCFALFMKGRNRNSHCQVL